MIEEFFKGALPKLVWEKKLKNIAAIRSSSEMNYMSLLITAQDLIYGASQLSEITIERFRRRNNYRDRWIWLGKQVFGLFDISSIKLDTVEW